MERTLHYTVPDSGHLLKVSQYLKRQGYSERNLTELKKTSGNVLVNESPFFLNERLSAGDQITIHLKENVPSENIIPVKLPLSVIYEDDDLIILDKPAKMPVHPSSSNQRNTLANALAWYYKEQGIPFVFRCTNRLDQDTSGLVLIAKHMISSSAISAMARQHQIRREYLAAVRGHVTPPSGTIDAPLSRVPGRLIVQMVDYAHGERAVTHYQTVYEKNGHSLVSLLLETGRTHQIRIHMKHLGYPLIGDYLYNPDMEHIDRQALHSYRLSFCHPVTKEPMDFRSPLPDDMQSIFNDYH